MQRKAILASLALVALPVAATIAGSALNGSSASPALTAHAAHAFLADNSGQSATVSDLSCSGFTVSWTPNPGQNYTIKVAGPGVDYTNTTNGTSDHLTGLSPSTTYTLTVTPDGGSSTDMPVTTTSC